MDPTALLSLALPAVTLGIVCVSVLCSLLVTVASIGIPIYFMRKNSQRAEALMASGTRGEATVLSLEDTGMLINHQPRVTLLLELRMPYGSPYQVKKTMTIPMIRISQVQVGAVIPVMVDMTDPSNPDKVGLLFK